MSEGDAKKEKRNMEIEGLVTERKSNSKQQRRKINKKNCRENPMRIEIESLFTPGYIFVTQKE